ncbi:MULTISPECIES: ABC transporter permease [Calditerrivibrio]|uniref:ABC transporter permease n=1 Tax=Calditerrivibrio TaxID=545865 RepID=UPI003C775935
MSLTLNSFILLIISIFGGTFTIWRDIEKKYAFTVLSYPISRASYLLQRFFAVVIVLFFINVVNLLIGLIVIKFSSTIYKSDLPLLLDHIVVAYFFSLFKYILILAFAFLFSSIATSFYVPIFLTISVYIIGNASQGLYDFVSKEGDKFNIIIKKVINFIYYTFPNLSSFDFTAHASYSLPYEPSILLKTFIYFILYLGIVILCTILMINRRDFT